MKDLLSKIKPQASFPKVPKKDGKFDFTGMYEEVNQYIETEHRQKGRSMNSLAKEMGMHAESLRHGLYVLGIKYKMTESKKRERAEELKAWHEKAKELRKQGLSDVAIGKIVGRHGSIVSKYFRSIKNGQAN